MATPISVPAGKLFWHNYPDRTGSVIKFQGINYAFLPIEFGETELRPGGALQRPNLLVGNADSIISDLIASYEDLVGARLLRKRTRR